MLCPKCKVGHAHRSHRRGILERLASVFQYYPYRCHGCKHRFLHRETSANTSGEHSSTEREIRATRSAKEWQRKKRDLILYGMAVLLFLAFLYFITRERTHSSEGSTAGLSIWYEGRLS